MKHALKSSSRIARAKRTRFGRLCCRLMGDKAGGVLMDYVLLGLGVTVAVALFVFAFGGAIGNAFEKFIDIITGRGKKAQETHEAGITAADQAVGEAHDHHDKIIE